MSSTDKRILLDVDGVLADFTNALASELSKMGHRHESGRIYNDDDLTEWDLKACYPRSAHRAIEQVMNRPGFFASIPRYPGAQKFYKALRKRGEVIAVTTVKGRAMQERYDWLIGLGFADPEIVLVDEHHHKAAVPGDAIIDDRIETLEACPHKIRIVFDRPWNRRSVVGVARAVDYDHCLRHLEASKV